MNLLQIVVGILLFAAATMVLYLWGLRRSMTQQRDLERALLGKCAARVVRRLKKQETITRKEIAREIQGVRAGLFWSRSRLEVQDAAAFVQKLTRYMVEQHLLEENRQRPLPAAPITLQKGGHSI